MVFDSMDGREWTLKFSLLNRKCYITGQSLKYKLCYSGVKPIRNIVNHHYILDIIYISQKEYLKILKKDLIQ